MATEDLDGFQDKSPKRYLPTKLFFPSRKEYLKLFLFCAGLTILVFFIVQSGIIEHYRSLMAVNIPLLVLAFGLSCANVSTKIYRWKYLSNKYNQDISWYQSSVVSVSSFFFANITPGKVGDLFKAYYMKQRFSLNLFDGISMILYERSFELLILFVTASLILVIQFGEFALIILGLASIMLMLLGAVYVKSEWFIRVAQRILVKVPFCPVEENMNLHIKKLPLTSIIIVFCITVVSLVFEFLRFWLVAQAFGFDLHPLYASVFFSLSIIAGLVTQIPLGIGITEGSLNHLLSEAGCISSVSMAIVLLDRMISMYFALILGFIFSKFSYDELKGVSV